MAANTESDWVNRVADEVEASVGAGKIVCASGVSPSGPVHLGNLRELMTTHLVADELRARGRDVTHLHSWDDFDRLRKVPVGIPASYAAHIGSPIGEIPDPWGELDSYAAHFIRPVEEAAKTLGIQCRWVRQAQAYRAGTYVEGMRTALRARATIFNALEQYRTPKPDDRPVEDRRAEYWPLQVYCRSCNHDFTTVHGWDEASDVVTYTCKKCGPDSFRLTDPRLPAKLPWKADWPMRWAYEGVGFEPGGEDHSTPGGSFSVGKEIVATVFGGRAPHFVGYGFVGMGGRTKISSSSGTDGTPEIALGFIEPALLRYLYIRRAPGTKFAIDFGADIWRQYDEWDALQRKCDAGTATPAEQQARARCAGTSMGPVAAPSILVPFRLLWTSADMTYGNTAQILRIVGAHLDDPPALDTLEAAIQPRLACATGWVERCLPEDERLHVKVAFDADTYGAQEPSVQESLKLLVGRMGDVWTLAGLTTLVYGVPKLMLGLPLEADPTPEIKALQRKFFIAIYQLILGSDTGPRLPTLFLSLGQEKITTLLGGG